MRTWRRNDDDIHGLDELASAIAFMIQADALSVLLVDQENELEQLVLRGNHGLAPVDVSLVRFQKGERARWCGLGETQSLEGGECCRRPSVRNTMGTGNDVGLNVARAPDQRRPLFGCSHCFPSRGESLL